MYYLSAKCKERLHARKAARKTKFKVSDIDIEYRKITVNNKVYKLSCGDYYVFKELYKNLNKEIAKSRLLEVGWGRAYVVENNVNVSIFNLRIVLQGSNYAIENIRGYGFRMIKISN